MRTVPAPCAVCTELACKTRRHAIILVSAHLAAADWLGPICRAIWPRLVSVRGLAWICRLVQELPGGE